MSGSQISGIDAVVCGHREAPLEAALVDLHRDKRWYASLVGIFLLLHRGGVINVHRLQIRQTRSRFGLGTVGVAVDLVLVIEVGLGTAIEIVQFVWFLPVKRIDRAELFIVVVPDFCFQSQSIAREVFGNLPVVTKSLMTLLRTISIRSSA